MRKNICARCGFKIQSNEESEYHPDASGNNDSFNTHKGWECPRKYQRQILKMKIQAKQAELDIIIRELARIG